MNPNHLSIPSPFKLYNPQSLNLTRKILQGFHLHLQLSSTISYLITLISILIYTHDSLRQYLQSHPHQLAFASLFFIYSLADSISHLCFCYRLRLLNHPDFALPLVYPTSIERDRVLRGVLSSFKTTTQARDCFSHWFYQVQDRSTQSWNGRSGWVQFHQIRTSNVKEFLASILFCSSPEDLDQSRTLQLESDLNLVSSVLDHTFPEGHDPNIHCMRPHLEPIKADYRPLWLYLILALIRISVESLFLIVGFRKSSIQTNGGPFGYWYHPGNLTPSARRPVPIVIISGLGGLITLFHYAIGLLWRTQRPMFLVGNESVSLNLFPSVHKLLNPSSLNPDSVDEDEVELIEKPSLPRWHTVSHSSKMRPMVLTLDEQATGLCKMLRRHGFCRRSQSSPHQQGGVLIIGHSLGTLLSSFFEHQEHDWVVGTIAIDPISVLTFLPDLVRTFVYAEPQTVGELLVRVIARDLGISTVIQRHFHWFQFVTLEPTARTHYILSEEDALVQHEPVAEYLARHFVPTTTLKGTPHGGFLFHHFPTVLQHTCHLIQKTAPQMPYTPPRALRRVSRIPFPGTPSLLTHPEEAPQSPPLSSSSPSCTPLVSPTPGSTSVTMSLSFSFSPLVHLSNPPSKARSRISRRLSFTRPIKCQ